MWMYIKKTTKTRSSLGSEKMIKTTKELCASYIKNKKMGKINPLVGGKECNLTDSQEKTKVLSLKSENFFFPQVRRGQTIAKEEPNFI